MLAVANIAGLGIPVPLGGLANRIGARKVYVSLMGGAGGGVSGVHVRLTFGVRLSCVAGSRTRATRCAGDLLPGYVSLKEDGYFDWAHRSPYR